MPLDLAAFLWTIAAFLLIGLPLIMAVTSLPEQLEFQEASDESLTPAQRDFFVRHDGILSPLGYHPLATLRVLNLGGPNLTRLYRDALGPGLCAVSALTTDFGGISTNYVEFISAFEDGGRLTTRNAQVSDVLEPQPGHLLRNFTAADPSELKRLHDLRLQELGKIPSQPGSKEEILRRANELHLSFCRHQVALGLLRFDAAAGRFRATAKLGLLGIGNYLNPFSDTFTWLRLFMVLTAGVGPPLLASRYAPATGLWMASAYVLAGFLVGLILCAKAFVWALLLGWLVSRLLPHEGPGFGVLGMAAAAELGSRLRHRLSRVA